MYIHNFQIIQIDINKLIFVKLCNNYNNINIML